MYGDDIEIPDRRPDLLTSRRGDDRKAAGCQRWTVTLPDIDEPSLKGAKRTMAEDYYQTLGVSKTAGKDEIKKAYKKLAMKYHPDKNKGEQQAEERFKKIAEAYAVLSDDDKRKQYDQFGAEGFSNRFSQEDIFKGFDINSLFEEFGFGDQLFSSLFGSGGGRKGGRSQGFSFDFGTGGFPGGGEYGRSTARSAHRDTELALPLTLEEAVIGGKKAISFDSGVGVDKIILAIPAGIEEGKKLKIKGKGAIDPMTGQRGDLFCRVSIESHPVFQREGSDLVMEQSVRLTELVLGGSISVQTLDHKRIDLKIPPLTRNNSVLRIKGKGIHKPGQEPGNLLVKLFAQLPEKLTDRQIELFKELAETGL
jgi:curved DNA-binding protein